MKAKVILKSLIGGAILSSWGVLITASPAAALAVNKTCHCSADIKQSTPDGRNAMREQVYYQTVQACSPCDFSLSLSPCPSGTMLVEIDKQGCSNPADSCAFDRVDYYKDPDFGWHCQVSCTRVGACVNALGQ